MIRNLATILLLLAWMAGFAQPSGRQPAGYWLGVPDSKQKLDSLNAWSFELSKDDPDSSMLLARAAVRCARTIGDEVGVALAYRRIGEVIRRTGGSDSALFYFRQAMVIDERAGNDTGIISSAMKIATVLHEKGQASEALDMLIMALDISRRTKDRKAEAIALNKMGPVYQDLGKMELALERLFQGLAIRKELGDPREIFLSHQNLGALYMELERYDKAEEHFKEMIGMARRANVLADMASGCLNLSNVARKKGDHEAVITWADSALTLYRAVKQPLGEAKALTSRATADMDLARFDQAEQGFREALALVEPLGRNDELAVLHFNLGDLAHRREDLHTASRELEQALEVTRKQTGASDTHMKVLRKLAMVRQQQDRLDEALALYKEYQDLRNARINEAVSEQLIIQEMRAKYDAELHIKEIEELKAERALEKEKNVRQTIQLYAFSGLAVLLLVVSVLLWRNNQHIRRLRAQETELHTQRVNDLLQQQEIRSLDAMMQGQEKERERIAKDLHDRLGSMLSAIKLQFSALEGRIAEMEAGQREQYQRVFSLLDDAVTEVRRISHDMIRGTLSQFGLSRALEDLRAAIDTPGKLQVELSMFGLDQRLDAKLEIALYRMVQEMVSNALKHARASQLTIQVTRTAGSVNLIVEDNGKGFDAAAIEGMGMGNIRARAAEFNGVVQVDTREGRGTSITIDIPLA